jgi:hypothetical protein
MIRFFDNSRAVILYLTLSLLYSKNTCGVVPELLMFLEPDDVLKLLDIYGGKVLKIPNKDDFMKELRTVLYYYLSRCTDLPKKEIDEIMSMDGNETRGLEERIAVWFRFLRDNNLQLPEKLFKSDTEMIKRINAEIYKGGN